MVQEEGEFRVQGSGFRVQIREAVVLDHEL
jgi:hypothetical protein